MKISINKLFGHFNYSFSFTNQVSIITSLNGFGKTTILKLIHYLYKREFNNLMQIDFESFSINFKDNLINVERKKDFLSIHINGNLIINFNPIEFEQRANQISYIRNQQTGKWTHANFLQNGVQPIAIKESDIISNIYFYNSSINDEWGKLPKTIFIKADRLIDLENGPQFFNSNNQITIYHTINTYSQELRNLINVTFNEYFTESQKLDSTFMNEIINYNGAGLTSEEYEDFTKQIKGKNDLFLKYGIIQALEESIPPYNKDHKEVFAIYIKHRLVKLSKFDQLLERCELFTSIINYKSYTNKSIMINMQDGITAKQNENKLDLKYLSNGEQNQLILLYEMLFRSQSIDYLLIDEPEVGLHVAWQLEFLDDLRKILTLNKTSSIIVTHSPQIINDEWSNVVDLGKSYDLS